MRNKKSILGEHVAFVDTADGIIVHPENEIAIEDAIFEAMKDYAKEVLIWVTKLKDGEGDYLIIHTDGQFYWSGDEDGDSPVSPEQIITLYEKHNK